MAIRYVLLDFDGTCTQVERVEANFLARYRALLEAANTQSGSIVDAWTTAVSDVRGGSPQAGWTLFDTPSTAPAAADPYILAYEAAKLLVRREVIATIPSDAYGTAYAENEAPWRDEIVAVLRALKGLGVEVAFVSNSATGGIQKRLDKLLNDEGMDAPPAVKGNASKFALSELPLGARTAAAAHRDVFEALPPAEPCRLLRRPIYLRRGHYFEAMCEVLHQLGGSGCIHWNEVLVVGDIYELDLALPKALKAHVHLVERATPYETYDFEMSLVPPDAVSSGLHGVVAHVTRLRTA